MRVLLTGVGGQVGHEIREQFRARSASLGGASSKSHGNGGVSNVDLVAIGSADCNFLDPSALQSLLREVRPQLVINPAAYTAVDKAESEPEQAHAINAVAPEVLARGVKALGGRLIHFSTDYVFDGTKPGAYVETDTPNPQSVYGLTKLAGEQAIVASGASHTILRTSWVFGAHGNNFAKTMLRLAKERDQLRVVNDQFGAPTSARFLADVVWQQVSLPEDQQRNGIYHVSCAGRTSWFEYAGFVIGLAREAGIPIKLPKDGLIPIPARDYPTSAARPGNSVFDTTKLQEQFGIVPPDWRDEVRAVIQALHSGA